jgi:3-oxoacyl-[acyl-carrier-protein] synthase-3
MAFTKILNTKIAVIAAAVPKSITFTKDYEWMSESERIQLENTTGIKQRRNAKSGTCTSDLAVELCNYIFQKTGISKDDIDVLVFVSQSRDYILPNTACIIQNRVGLSKKCMSFDVPLGCSGYTYGLTILSSIISAAGGSMKRGILIAGDVSSGDMNYRDKTTYPLFGDAASATIVEYDAECAMPIYNNLQTDGSGFDSLIIPAGAARNKFTNESLIEREFSPGVWRNAKNVYLDGLKIFEFTIAEVADNITELLKKVPLNIENIDYYFLHQANKLMNETIRKQLRVKPEYVPYSLNEFGNTSSASIPLTIVCRAGNNIQNKTCVLAGFGVGLSWSSSLLKFSNTVEVLPLLEL